MKCALLLVLLIATPAQAAERSIIVTSFDRLRVDGPFDVRVATRRPPSARIEGTIRAADAVSIRVEGTTLIVSTGPKGWTEVPVIGKPSAPIVYLGTLTLRSATVIGGGTVQIDGPLRGQRIDLQVTGSGGLAIAALDADQLNATLLGPATMALGGRGARVRLIGSGPGRLDAGALRGDEVTVRLEGPGAIAAQARYTADAISTGIGAITIYGKPACKVKAAAGGPISCGAIAVPPVK
ncbi:GIN domain-containing protein [Sphingomonas psychrolutea]|uniref:Putative auto-transporter adhesin head GIN domain-containing protein n=1 Tax=Sphingomonas psychrolutea TaxID=1259676 RepID=A0ABQ1GWG8_9SPHN|nr:DUF2807 domain-containing protein [Sphingomonas psychrolutea]GGA51397.1 hypothetical protein GCM10011395_22210 [Sphingomonas psychrolutea]